MGEHIYTIPINEHFGKKCGCPLCSLFDMLERNEIELITGASMMEPNIRVKTNEYGFCAKHFQLMLKVGKRLPVALILQSHMEEVRAALDKKNGDGQAKFLQELEDDCYVCRRIQANMNNFFDNLFYLYKTDSKFRALFKEQPYFCLPHYKTLLTYAKKHLAKKEYVAFCEEIFAMESAYLAELSGDIDWFCKKFDYRFAKEDWKNSKDAIERTVYTLTGVLPELKSDG